MAEVSTEIIMCLYFISFVKTQSIAIESEAESIYCQVPKKKPSLNLLKNRKSNNGAERAANSLFAKK
jgi:hypothetical protein